MDELEKMRSGDFYQLTAPEVEHYQEAGIIWNDEFRQGNNLDRPAQLLRLKMHLGALGDQASFGTSFSCLNGPNIYIGHHFLAAGGLTIEDAGEVHIGDYVTMGPNCLLTTIAHPRSTRQRRQRLAQAKRVEIGNDVCLGAGGHGFGRGQNRRQRGRGSRSRGGPGSASQWGLCWHPGRKIDDLANDCG